MPNQFLSPEGDLETFNYFVTEYWLIDQYVGDTLWVWGDNSNAQLGVNIQSPSNPRLTPTTTFAGGTNWKGISTGASLFGFSAIKTDGTLWVWGTNFIGQLGNNTTTTAMTPITTFAGGNNWKQASNTPTVTAAIKTDGTLWIWGDASQGKLGNNTATNSITPITTFAGGANWKQVACGDKQVAAIKTDGTLWTWGQNYQGLLGDNTTISRSTPVTTFAGGNNWKQVTCGSNYMAAIKTDGTLWTWGQNYAGVLGDNTTISRSTPVTTFAGGTNWKQVTCGSVHTAAIKTDGTLWIWGNNGWSQLGIDQSFLNNKSTPVTTFAGGTNWKQVAGGQSHTAAIKTDGTLWTWGRNSSGQLGTNTVITNISTPVTTFAGGTNWKQVTASNGGSTTAAVTSGTDPTFFIS